MKRSHLVAIPILTLSLLGTSVGTAFAVPYDPAPGNASATALFTTDAIVVDGVADAAYAAATVQSLTHAKNGAGTAALGSTPAVSGSFRTIWDGPTLYILAEVNGDTTDFPAGDGVEISLDFYNDKIEKFEEDDGVFTVHPDGTISYNTNNGTLGSPHADATNPFYTGRLAGYAATKTATGYTVEVALHIDSENGVGNGTAFGVDVAAIDAVGMTVSDPCIPWGFSCPSSTVDVAARLYWSNTSFVHVGNQEGNRHWGTITLAGWDETTPFPADTWWVEWLVDLANVSGTSVKGRALNPNATWTVASLATLNAALLQATSALPSSDSTALQNAAKAMVAALRGMRLDGAYPDPQELDDLMTLPDPWTFFDDSLGSGGKVATLADWDARVAEILDLAQYYEYGYKPGVPDSQTATAVVSPGWYPGAPDNLSLSTELTLGSVTDTVTSTITLPTDPTCPKPYPVLLTFDGAAAEYTAACIAQITIPLESAGFPPFFPASAGFTNDDRFASVPSGTFWRFFPYSPIPGAEGNRSTEIAAAWGASRIIDSLEQIVAAGASLGTAGTADQLLDPDSLAVTGFSINGKFAFASAVFDDRFDVVIPGAAGVSGPSPYRYTNFGVTPAHEYTWGTANGSEVYGDHAHHQPQRSDGIFKRFAPDFFRLYERIDGAYGYTAKLPYDHHLLVAALAPRAIVLQNTVTDYADSSESDATGLQGATPVYQCLGVSLDNLAYNYRQAGEVPVGADPHGTNAAQLARSASYLAWYFNGTAMTSADKTYLATDPFMTAGVGGTSVYDTYFGGFDTMMPWRSEGPCSPNVTLVSAPTLYNLSDPVAAGDTIEVAVELTNESLTQATGVGLDVPAGATVTYTWPDSTKPGVLASGQKAIALVMYSLTAADAGLGGADIPLASICDTGCSATDGGGLLWAHPEVVGGILKDGSPVTEAHPGDIVTFQFTVNNTTTPVSDPDAGRASAVSLASQAFSGTPVLALTCAVDQLAAGESTICQGAYTVTQDDLKAGTVTLAARVLAKSSLWNGVVVAGSLVAGPGVTLSTGSQPLTLTLTIKPVVDVATGGIALGSTWATPWGLLALAALCLVVGVAVLPTVGARQR